MPAASELIAHGRTEQQVQEFIGADWLIYQDLDDLIRAVRYDNGDITHFDTSCFSGHYVTGDVSPEYLGRLEQERSDRAKGQRQSARRRGPFEIPRPGGDDSKPLHARSPAAHRLGPLLKFLIIDDHADYRRLLAHHVSARWPDALIREYDPQLSGRLPEAFSGAGNDVVLLGHPCGRGDVLDWVRQFRALPRFPPVVVIGSGEERQIVAALHAGADDYVGKPTLTNARLVEAIEDALKVPVARCRGRRWHGSAIAGAARAATAQLRNPAQAGPRRNCHRLPCSPAECRPATGAQGPASGCRCGRPARCWTAFCGSTS